MASFNKVIIVGHLGRDPELKYTPQGNAVCKFSVATTERRKDAAGEMEEITTWFRVTCWGQQAEFTEQNIRKGQQVYVEGRLRLETYTDREGQQRASLEVAASAVYSLAKLSEAEAAGASASPQPKEQAKAATATANKTAAKKALQGDLRRIEEDDIPF